MKIWISIPGQRGNIIVTTAISLIALIGFLGLALDIGHLWIAKTELQNAADAAALAAAKMMDQSIDSLTNATNEAVSIPNKFNFRQKNVVLDPNNVTFADDLAGPYAVAGGANYATARFVRVVINPENIGFWFAPVLNKLSESVGARAIAGPSSALRVACELVPLAVCDDPDMTTPEKEAFQVGELYTIRMPGGDFPTDEASGNYLILDYGSCGGGGGKCTRIWTAGGYIDCIDLEGTAQTEPGVEAGPVAQGLNTRFGDYVAGLSEATYPHDSDIREGITYSQYAPPQGMGPNNPHGDGVDKRRILAVPMIDCSKLEQGKNPPANVDITGFGCFFMQKRAEQSGGAAIKVEYIEDCVLPEGVPTGEERAGPIIIQLYK